MAFRTGSGKVAMIPFEIYLGEQDELSNGRMDRGVLVKQAGFKQSWPMLVRRRLISKQKSRLIVLRTRARQLPPPPPPFSLPPSFLFRIFCFNFDF